MTVQRFGRSFMFPLLAALALGACAVRRRELVTPPAPVSATPVWRFEGGDVIRTRVYREPDLSGETTVSANGDAFFLGVGRLHVEGLSLDSLQVELNTQYRRMLVDPAVDVTMARDVVISGQVRIPGVYPVDPSLTVLGLLAKAGGPSGLGRIPLLTLIKADGHQFVLPREVRLTSLDIRHGDGIFVLDDSFIGRNAQSLSAYTILLGLILSGLSLLLVVIK